VTVTSIYCIVSINGINGTINGTTPFSPSVTQESRSFARYLHPSFLSETPHFTLFRGRLIARTYVHYRSISATPVAGAATCTHLCALRFINATFAEDDDVKNNLSACRNPKCEARDQKPSSAMSAIAIFFRYFRNRFK
jgi:hypothetical protein